MLLWLFTFSLFNLSKPIHFLDVLDGITDVQIEACSPGLRVHAHVVVNANGCLLNQIQHGLH